MTRRALVILPPVLSVSHHEVLTAARIVGDVEVFNVGEPDLDVMAQYGVSRVFTPDGVDLVTPAQVAEVVAQLAHEREPDAIIMNASFIGKETAARLAVLLDAGAIVDVNSLRMDGDRIVVGKTVFQGTWDTESTATRGPAILAVKPTSFEPKPEPGGYPEVERIAVELSPVAAAVELVERVVPPPSDRPNLSEARIVVAGGRGVDGDFSLVEQLADALGGAVGATRVATDEHWIDHSAQIGQTGVTIAPKLYIGLGVSGAVHHTAGMTGAEVVVAVNTDDDAPIFEIADFGIVGDLNTVVPAILEALRQ